MLLMSSISELIFRPFLGLPLYLYLHPPSGKRRGYRDSVCTISSLHIYSHSAHPILRQCGVWWILSRPSQATCCPVLHVIQYTSTSKKISDVHFWHALLPAQDVLKEGR